MLISRARTVLAIALAAALPALIAAQQRGRGDNPFPAARTRMDRCGRRRR